MGASGNPHQQHKKIKNKKNNININKIIYISTMAKHWGGEWGGDDGP